MTCPVYLFVLYMYNLLSYTFNLCVFALFLMIFTSNAPPMETSFKLMELACYFLL